jgi:hypothetical protein
VLVENVTMAMVGINILVDTFMANRLLAVPAHHASDLLRAQISLYLRLHQRSELDSCGDWRNADLQPSAVLFVAVAVLPTVAQDLPG